MQNEKDELERLADEIEALPDNEYLQDEWNGKHCISTEGLKRLVAEWRTLTLFRRYSAKVMAEWFAQENELPK